VSRPEISDAQEVCMSRLGTSPPSFCLCGHDFHTGPCDGRTYVDEPGLGFCHCPDGELDGDR